MMILKMIFMEILAPAGTMIIQVAAVGMILTSLTHAQCAVLVQVYKSVSKRQHQCVQIAILIVMVMMNQRHLGGLE
jgi:hypothetical protein